MGHREEAQALEALAQALARKVNAAPRKPKLRIVEAPKPGIYDSITRDSVLSRIRRLRKMYGLSWLVEQATFNRPNLEALTDQELSSLLRDMEQARECIVENIPFEDAGLVRNTTHLLPSDDGD